MNTLEFVRFDVLATANTEILSNLLESEDMLSARL
jgi:hypothetical protein